MENINASQGRESLQKLNAFVHCLRSALDQICSSSAEDTPTPTLQGCLLVKCSSDARRIEERLKALLNHLHILIIGSTFKHKVALMNELVLVGLYTRSSVENYAATCTDKYRISAEKYGDRDSCYELSSLQIDCALSQMGVKDAPYHETGSGLLPETENFQSSHIIYKVQYGSSVRVLVEFEDPSVISRLIAHANKFNTMKENEQTQVQSFVHAVGEGDVASHAVGLFVDTCLNQKFKDRCIAANNLFNDKKLCDSCVDSRNCDINLLQFLPGKTLIFSPQSPANRSDLLIEHVSQVRCFIHRFSSFENDIWSIIKETIIELPGPGSQRNGIAYVNFPDLRYLDDSRSTASNLLNKSHTVIHVCDERKVEGDFRDLFKHTKFGERQTKDSQRRHIFALIVSKQLQRVSYQTHRLLTSRLCSAKEVELKSMHVYMSHAKEAESFFGLPQKSSRKKMVKISTFAVGRIGGQLDPMLRSFFARVDECCGFVQVQRRRIERSVTLLCDTLERAHRTSCTPVAVKNAHEEYVLEQLIASLSLEDYFPDCSISTYDIDANESLSQYWSRVWFCKMIDLFQKLGFDRSLAAMELTGDRISSVPPTTARLKRKRSCSPDFVQRMDLLYVYAQALRALDLPVHIARLRELNIGLLNDLCTKLRQKMCQRGLHRQSKKYLKRTIWLFHQHCQNYFTSHVTIKWFISTLEHHALSCFHEELLLERNLVLSSKKIARMIDSVVVDIAAIVISRLRAIRYAYHYTGKNTQGARAAFFIVHDICSSKCVQRSFEFPLYDENSQTYIVTWKSSSSDASRQSWKRLRDLGRRHFHELNQSSRRTIEKLDASTCGLNAFSTGCYLINIVSDALEFLERETLRRRAFFEIWGSDLLVTFYFFREITSGIIQEKANNMLYRFVRMWMEQTAGVTSISSLEDFLFYNEGYYVLHRLGLKHPTLWHHIRRSASVWKAHLPEYLHLRPYSCIEDDKCSSPNVKFDQLSTAMVWSFFLREYVVALWSPEIPGKYTSSEFGNVADIRKTNFTTATQFHDVCYFITHRIFTASSWCQFELIPDQWQTESQFLRYYLPCLVEAADVELVAFETQYHATVCSLGTS
ncbi:hypothetical protein BE221DRAFT_142726 [Ostreococcus tauri]|uniref:Uncharacterized protein n=1 Tax=Ostreococcus tauri TaxID=70448 RepID=A0A1Y5I492_OSTTA|nr:hypothetical protein BE221DRAFT_142726 [Ostreococcus tauri]